MAAAESLTQAEREYAPAHISATTLAQRDRAILFVMILAGLRVSEVANLKLNDARDANGNQKNVTFNERLLLPLNR